MISELEIISYDSLLITDKSQPIINGALLKDQSAKWVFSSSLVSPPFPISSISGSFQPPGPDYSLPSILVLKLNSRETHKSDISWVVLHELATYGAQFTVSSSPQLHTE